ncbi:MAG TPA: hypothetical protein VKR06_42835 [Ktedonosporobacter sp.]|nr:hypothetical protein [Ktedonosporobacter sp.]
MYYSTLRSIVETYLARYAHGSLVPHHRQLIARCNPSKEHGWMLSIFLAGCLIISLAACSSATPSTSAPRPTQAHPTSTTLPPGTLLYQADWSHGLTDWEATKGWRIVGKALESDLSDNSITVPYKPTVLNYAVEIQLQVVNVPHDGGEFLITADKAPGKDGYQARVLSLLTAGQHPYATHPLSEVVIDPEWNTAETPGTQTIDFEPGANMRTYRVEIQDQVVRFLADGTRMSRATSEKTNFLSSGPIHLLCSGVVIRVESLRIVSF